MKPVVPKEGEGIDELLRRLKKGSLQTKQEQEKRQFHRSSKEKREWKREKNRKYSR